MKRALCLAVLFLSACASEPSGLSPADAYDRAENAIAAHDVETAHALLREAAAHNHIPSLEGLAEVYEHGFRVPGGDASALFVDTWPGQRMLTHFRLARAVSRGVRAGDPEALLSSVYWSAGGFWTDQDGVVSPKRRWARRDSARAVYHRIADQDVDPFRLALLAKSLGEEEGYRRHLRDAAAGGDPTACSFLIWFDEEDPQTTTGHVEGLARYFDRVDACQPGHPIPYPAMSPLRDLRAQLDLGTPAAAVALDSLRHLGVFERHPELADAVGPAARS